MHEMLVETYIHTISIDMKVKYRLDNVCKILSTHTYSVPVGTSAYDIIEWRPTCICYPHNTPHPTYTITHRHIIMELETIMVQVFCYTCVEMKKYISVEINDWTRVRRKFDSYITRTCGIRFGKFFFSLPLLLVIHTERNTCVVMGRIKYCFGCFLYK